MSLTALGLAGSVLAIAGSTPSIGPRVAQLGSTTSGAILASAVFGLIGGAATAAIGLGLHEGRRARVILVICLVSGPIFVGAMVLLLADAMLSTG